MKVETPGQIVVHLDGSQLPFAADDVLDYKIDLRPVKGSFSVFFRTNNIDLLGRLPQRILRFVPLFRSTDVFG